MFAKSFLTYLFIFICFISQSQNSDKAKTTCSFLLKELDAAENSSNFKLAVRYGIIRERSCPQYGKSDYHRLLTDLKNAINNEKVMEMKSLYIDTICQVYQKIERKQLYDQSDDLVRATYLIKSSKPNFTKADTLYTRAFMKGKSSFSDLHVNLYAFTIFQLYTTADDKSKNEYKLRMINTFFFLSDNITKTGLNPKSQQNIETYFKGVVKDCDDLDSQLTDKLFTKNKSDQVSMLQNIKRAHEFHTCYRSDEYNRVIDSLISLKPDGEVYFAKAKIIYDKHTKCDSNTFEQKTSLYYAMYYLDLARSKGINVKELETMIKTSLPSENELVKNGFNHGQKVWLTCWGTEITIP
jgi:hypothetical protein